MERLIQEGPDGRFQLLMGSEAVVPLDFCSLVVAQSLPGAAAPPAVGACSGPGGPGCGLHHERP